jgi:magnesium chelatase subunit I
MAQPRTVGELHRSGYRVLSVKEEMRQNLIRRLREGGPLFPCIFCYDETLIPQIENEILSGQDIFFLGERGQAKTRIARTLINLLDDEIPIVAGSEINDNPYAPISAKGRAMAEEMGEDLPNEWVPREARYGE